MGLNMGIPKEIRTRQNVVLVVAPFSHLHPVLLVCVFLSDLMIFQGSSLEYSM